VASFTVIRQSLEETPLAEPVIAAFGTFTGAVGGLLAPLRGIKPQDVRIGMKVKARFASAQPTNTICDLSWEPAS
jgi:uncharacterized OB-fold protein